MSWEYHCKGCDAESEFLPHSWWTFEFCCRECWQLDDSRKRLAKAEGFDVFLNGAKLKAGVDYSSPDPKSGVVTFAPGALSPGTNQIKIEPNND